jgi:GTP-binding protein
VRPHSSPTVLNAAFVAEARTPGSVPPEAGPEIAIAGRSNVGKSTLLNRLVGTALARTSKTPGRTRGIMIYDLTVRWPGETGARDPLRLVDLPGYGYAKVSQAERRRWQPLVERYVKNRRTLVLFIILIDARRGIEHEERQLAEWLADLGVPFRLVVTKVDKLSASERGVLGTRVRKELGAGVAGPFLVSGQTGEGVDRLWAVIGRAARGELQDGPSGLTR